MQASGLGTIWLPNVPTEATVPSLFGTRDRFGEDNFSTDRGGDFGFGMIQLHYIHCALYLFYYYIITHNEIII